MRSFLKDKLGEKQSAVRLAVIAGNTFVIGSTLAILYCMNGGVEPRHPEAFACAAIIGWLTLLIGTSAAAKKGNPIKGVGMRVLVYCFFAIICGGIVLPTIDKPVIYLYPEQAENVLVQLEYEGKIIADYPALDPALGGWRVTAYPDGRLTDSRDGREYSYLFWEGTGKTDWDLSTGFVVKGSETREFLQAMLPKLGLTPRELNEFIVYWYPKMQGNRFNLIHFAGSEYTDTAKLTITPRPDSVIRVFMVWKPLWVKVSVPAQKFTPVERNGFTVVEWGGTEVR